MTANAHCVDVTPHLQASAGQPIVARHGKTIVQAADSDAKVLCTVCAMASGGLASLTRLPTCLCRSAHYAVKDAVSTRWFSACAVISSMRLDGVTKRPVGASSVRQPADQARPTCGSLSATGSGTAALCLGLKAGHGKHF